MEWHHHALLLVGGVGGDGNNSSPKAKYIDFMRPTGNQSQSHERYVRHDPLIIIAMQYGMNHGFKLIHPIALYYCSCLNN